MKIKYVFEILTGIIICSTIILLGCEEKNNSTINEDQKQDSTKHIHFLKSDLGGCNNKATMENIEAGEERNDTVIINMSNDSLQISVGLNYICCAPFITNCSSNNDSIFISITDTCPNPNNCYCKCYCYYTFDYYFDNISDNEYYWQIILSDPREINDTIFDKGIIEIAEY